MNRFCYMFGQLLQLFPKTETYHAMERGNQEVTSNFPAHLGNTEYYY
jgi:hypothetical protein